MDYEDFERKRDEFLQLENFHEELNKRFGIYYDEFKNETERFLLRGDLLSGTFEREDVTAFIRAYERVVGFRTIARVVPGYEELNIPEDGDKLLKILRKIVYDNMVGQKTPERDIEDFKE